MQKITTLKDIIDTCQQGDRILVLDHKGNLQLAILGGGKYYELLNGKKPVEKVIDPEEVNKKILQAQLEEAKKSSLEPLYGPSTNVEIKTGSPQGNVAFGELDELIDPTFNFDPPVEK